MLLWRDFDFMSGLILALIMVLNIIGVYLPAGNFILPVATLQFLVFAGCNFMRLQRVARIFLLLSIALLALSLLFDPQASENLLQGLQRAIFYSSFFTAVSFMRDAALHSDLLRRAGETIIRQHPNRQYFILTIGGHLFGMMMNFGSLGMLGVMIKRSAESLTADLREKVLRQGFSALLRGFSATGNWSPMALSPLVVASIMPGITWESILPYGLAAAAALMLFGWLVHVWLESGAATGFAGLDASAWESRLAMRPILGLMAIVFAIFSAILLLRRVAGVSTSEAVVLVLPVSSLLWALLQSVRRPGNLLTTYGWRLRQLVGHTIASQRTEIVVLATAGFIGGAVSGLLPYDTMGQWLRQVPLAYLALPLMVFWAVIVLGYLGINPLITVTVIGTLIAQPESFGIEPLFLAMVYLVAWSLTGQFSPFTASNLLLASIAGVNSRMIVHDWNGRFAIVLLSVCSVLVVIGAAILHR